MKLNDKLEFLERLINFSFFEIWVYFILSAPFIALVGFLNNLPVPVVVQFYLALHLPVILFWGGKYYIVKVLAKNWFDSQFEKGIKGFSDILNSVPVEDVGNVIDMEINSEDE